MLAFLSPVNDSTTTTTSAVLVHIQKKYPNKTNLVSIGLNCQAENHVTSGSNFSHNDPCPFGISNNKYLSRSESPALD